MEKYLKNGEEIFNKFCRSVDNRPVMLPRAPRQTYIDGYPDESSSAFKNDKNRQSDYEAEVLVFRALEKFDEPMIVLHGFEYTHHQYRLCDERHVRKECTMCKGKNAANIEGECDFLIIYRGMFVIIEVKNVRPVFRCDPNFHLCMIGEDIDTPECGTRRTLEQELNGTFSKSLRQREKVKKLIKSLNENVKMLSFTAYPNLKRKYYERLSLGEDMMSSMIFKESISDFNQWWHRNVSSCSIQSDNTASMKMGSDALMKIAAASKRTRNMLLAIWCTDGDHFDPQKCSLGWCIREIDEKLKSGKFVYRENNPKTVRAPNVIKDYLNVENFTKQQYDVFNSEKKCLWINGPAGSGKSVILAGRIIQQAQSDQKKIIVYKFSHRQVKTQLFQALVKAKVQCNEINFDEHHDYDADHPHDSARRESDYGIDLFIDNFLNESTEGIELESDSDSYGADELGTDLSDNDPIFIRELVMDIAGNDSRIFREVFPDYGYRYVDYDELGYFDGYYGYDYGVGVDAHCSKSQSEISYTYSERNEIYFEEKYESRASKLSELIRKSIEKNQVTIVNFTPESGRNFPLAWLIDDQMQSLQECSFFIDDVHAMLLYEDNFEHIPTYLEISSVLEILSPKPDRIMQVTVDAAQSWFRFFDYASYLHKLVTDKLISSQMITLSTNLRNTRNIAEFLSILRDMIVEICHAKDKVNMLAPKQSLGHFIHGPKVEVHFFSHNKESIIGNVLSRILTSLCKDKLLKCSDIGLIYDLSNKTRWDSLLYALSTLDDEARDSISFCDVRHCFSTEFPAVIVFHGIMTDFHASRQTDDFRELYLAVSRARVYCSIILFPVRENSSSDENYQLYLKLLGTISDVAHIMRY